MAAVDEIIAEALELQNLQPEMRCALQNALESAFREQLGGQKIYVAKRKRIDPELVKASFNGQNTEEVKKQFGISKARIYQIINELV